MKGFLRSVAAVLLIVLLSTFCLWRYEKTDTVAVITAYFGNAVSRLEQLISLTKSAVEAGDDDEVLPTTPYDPESDYSAYDPTQAVNVSLEEAIRTGITNLDAKIYFTDVSPAPTKEEVKAAVASIIYSSPEYFYLRPSYNMSTTQAGIVEYIAPSYSSTNAAEIAAMRATYEATLDQIVAGAPQDGSDFDKILYLHDYFVQNYDYDDNLEIRDAYRFFTEKKGVCQAYMLALIAAAERLDIESIPVTSDVMKHAWNLVRIDGAWYHIDLTWDDARSYPTIVSYTYFLQSDAGLTAIDAGKQEQNRHRGWVAAAAATDTKYDAVMFRNANTPMLRHNGVYYCTGKATDTAGSVRGVIYAGADVTAMSPLREITGGCWWSSGYRYYTDCYAGLAIDENYLYYHSGNSICRIDLNNAEDYHVYLVSDLASGESIYGFFGIEDGVLSYLIANTLAAEEYRVGIYTVTE